MLLDGLALVLLAIFVLLGAARGAVLSGLSLLTLVLAYATALVAAPRLGSAVGEAIGVLPLVGAVLAGTAAFAVVFLLSTGLAAVLRRMERERLGDARRPFWDRLGGASFGAARGALIVVLVAWLAHWVDAAAQAQEVDRDPVTQGSRAADVAQTLVEEGVRTVLGANAGATVAARVLARPQEALADLRNVVEHPAMGQLAVDQTFWEMVQFDAVGPALDRPSFRAVARDADLRLRLASVGVIDETSATNPGEFRRSAREVLEQLGPRLRRLREDPELHRLAEDPEVVRLLERGELVALLRHEGFQRVLSGVLSNEVSL